MDSTSGTDVSAIAQSRLRVPTSYGPSLPSHRVLVLDFRVPREYFELKPDAIRAAAGVGSPHSLVELAVQLTEADPSGRPTAEDTYDWLSSLGDEFEQASEPCFRNAGAGEALTQACAVLRRTIARWKARRILSASTHSATPQVCEDKLVCFT